METSSASSLSASGICSGLLTGAISTLMPFCNMGVTTMKIISRTSITSTMGVTLISELIFAPSFLFANAIASISVLPPRFGAERRSAFKLGRPGAGLLQRRTSNSLRKADRALFLNGSPANIAALLQEVIDEFAGRVVHLHVEGFHATGKIVEHHDGRDGDEQADGRRNQRFRNTAGDCRQAGGPGVVDTDEGIQNAHHRSEQSRSEEHTSEL